MAGGRPVVGLAPASGGAQGRPVVGLAPTKGPTGRTVVGLAGSQAAPKKSGGGFLGALKKYSGAELAGNLGKDIGQTAVGIGPGLYKALKTTEQQTVSRITRDSSAQAKADQAAADIATAVGHQYKDYYGHNVGHNLYTHPLQPLLDAATLASGGASAVAKGGELAAKAGAISDTSRLAKLGERATIETRSPRKIATGKGPVHEEITSTKPLVKGRELVGAKRRSSDKLLMSKRLGEKYGGRVERRGGEAQRYGKQIQAEATQKTLQRLQHFEPYQKAVRGLSPGEWTALHIRAMDIHPDDLAELWKGTPAEKTVTDGRIRSLVLKPSKTMVRAEPQLRDLSKAGERLYKQNRLLKDETASARPDLTKRQAAALLGRPVRDVHGEPYYFPHTIEPPKNVSPLAASGGGKAVPRKLGSTKENTGALALHGKLHLRSDVLGPEFLRRVKYVKYDEIHNALRRGAVRISRHEIDTVHGGKLPKGYEYLREKASTRIPPTIRGEAEQHVPIDKLIPHPEDLHQSKLGEGFSTTDATQAHTSGGQYYIIPKTTVRAATGEFTRSSDFTRRFVKQPLQIWRAAVLGLRVGFFTNNLVGNSIMYAAKTGGQGALRDLFGAIMESHGRDVARKVLDDPATPPKLRGDLYKEYFPEQIQGTFGRTQSPATSAAHLAVGRAGEGYRKVTGAIPKITSKVAEETPRRALIRHYIRHSPEFKRVYQKLPAEQRKFEIAARRVLEGEGPRYQRFISKQVNQALGDYMHLSPTERNVLRNALPFYSWYRAITTTTYHLAADTPGRADALALIGRIGKDESDKALGAVPSFLKGAVPLGEGKGGTKKVLATQGLNPYASVSQLGSGITGDVGNLGLNPFLMAAATAYAKATQQGGKASPAEIGGQALLAMLRGLPPSRLSAPLPPSKLYPNRGRKSELLSYLGAPVKEYDPSVAAQQAAQGR